MKMAATESELYMYMSGVEIKGQVRDGLLYCVRRKSCSFTYEMEKGALSLGRSRA